jgi:hypothetical protein
MSRPKKHVPLPSCTDGMFAFDGGAFDLATHEVWAICASTSCAHSSCLGALAGDTVDGVVLPPAVFRVRNRRDLKKHLSPDGTDLAASTNVLVVPKGTLKGRPTPEQVRTGLGIEPPADSAMVVATGSISVQQARKLKKFPLTSAAGEVIERLCSLPLSPHQEDTQAVRNRNRNFLENLVTRHGIYHVEREMTRKLQPGPDGRTPSLGSAADTVNVTLADRDGVGRLSRAYSKKYESQGKKTSEVVQVIAGPHLAELRPFPGEGVAGRLAAPAIGSWTPHSAIRLFDRVYGEMTENDLYDALAGRSLNPELLQSAREMKEALPSILNAMLSEGVFSTGTRDAPLPARMRHLVGGVNGGGSRLSRPSIYSDEVAVTCPHPFSPRHVVVLIGEVGPATVDRGSGERRHEFRLLTAIPMARNGDLLEEVLVQRPKEQECLVGPHRAMHAQSGAVGGMASSGHVYSSVPHLVSYADDLLKGVADHIPAYSEEEQKLAAALGFG